MAENTPIGRFDVHCAASTMGRYHASPKQGQLDSVMIICVYLKNYRKQRIVLYYEVPELPHRYKDEHK